MDPEETTQEAGSTEANPDFSKTVEDLIKKELDGRFSGFQSSVDKKFGSLASMLEELKTANLTPEEQEQLETRKESDRIASLERENALLKLRKQYPEEVDFLENFFGAESLEAQIATLAEFRKVKAEPPAPVDDDEDEEEEPTPVEGNNARRRAKPTVGDAMTDELADSILSAANQPGMLRKVRDMISGKN